MQCPKCKTSEKITLISFDFPICYDEKSTAQKSNYFLENELTANAKCWNCDLIFPVYSRLEFKTDYVYKPILKKQEITIIDSRDFNIFVRECYGGDFDFVSLHQVPNNSEYKYIVGENRYFLSGDKEKEKNIRSGHYPNHCAHYVFKCLYEDGYIEKGVYKIKVSY